MPPFMALADLRTSGTNRMPSRKSIPTMRMPLDQRVGQDRVGSPAALQQDVDALLDFLLETVVEVVVHLLDEIGVAQLAENDFRRPTWPLS